MQLCAGRGSSSWTYDTRWNSLGPKLEATTLMRIQDFMDMLARWYCVRLLVGVRWEPGMSAWTYLQGGGEGGVVNWGRLFAGGRLFVGGACVCVFDFAPADWPHPQGPCGGRNDCATPRGSSAGLIKGWRLGVAPVWRRRDPGRGGSVADSWWGAFEGLYTRGGVRGGRVAIVQELGVGGQPSVP